MRVAERLSADQAIANAACVRRRQRRIHDVTVHAVRNLPLPRLVRVCLRLRRQALWQRREHGGSVGRLAARAGHGDTNCRRAMLRLRRQCKTDRLGRLWLVACGWPNLSQSGRLGRRCLAIRRVGRLWLVISRVVRLWLVRQRRPPSLSPRLPSCLNCRPLSNWSATRTSGIWVL